MNPKIWGERDNLPARAVGEAKIRQLAQVDVPYLSASGLGFSARKRGMFTEVELVEEKKPDEGALIRGLITTVDGELLNWVGSSERSTFKPRSKQYYGEYAGRGHAVQYGFPQMTTFRQGLRVFTRATKPGAFYVNQWVRDTKLNKGGGTKGRPPDRPQPQRAITLAGYMPDTLLTVSHLHGFHVYHPSMAFGGYPVFANRWEHRAWFGGWLKGGMFIVETGTKEMGVDPWGLLRTNSYIRVVTVYEDSAYSLYSHILHPGAVTWASHAVCPPVVIRPGLFRFISIQLASPDREAVNAKDYPPENKVRFWICEADVFLDDSGNVDGMIAGVVGQLKKDGEPVAMPSAPVDMPWDSTLMGRNSHDARSFERGAHLVCSDGKTILVVRASGRYDTSPPYGWPVWATLVSESGEVSEVEVDCPATHKATGAPPSIRAMYIGKTNILARVQRYAQTTYPEDEPPIPEVQADNLVDFIYSADDGQSWEVLSPTGLPSMNNALVGIPSVLELLPLGDYESGRLAKLVLPVKQEGWVRLYTSEDGGKTWVASNGGYQDALNTFESPKLALVPYGFSMADYMGSREITRWGYTTMPDRYPLSDTPKMNEVVVVRLKDGSLAPKDLVRPWIYDSDYEEPAGWAT